MHRVIAKRTITIVFATFLLLAGVPGPAPPADDLAPHAPGGYFGPPKAPGGAKRTVLLLPLQPGDATNVTMKIWIPFTAASGDTNDVELAALSTNSTLTFSKDDGLVVVSDAVGTAAGEAKAEALWNAKRTLREYEIEGAPAYRHPSYWSAFVLFGAP